MRILPSIAGSACPLVHALDAPLLTLFAQGNRPHPNRCIAHLAPFQSSAVTLRRRRPRISASIDFICHPGILVFDHLFIYLSLNRRRLRLSADLASIHPSLFVSYYHTVVVKIYTDTIVVESTVADFPLLRYHGNTLPAPHRIVRPQDNRRAELE
jgi:hypothetical protein